MTTRTHYMDAELTLDGVGQWVQHGGIKTFAPYNKRWVPSEEPELDLWDTLTKTLALTTPIPAPVTGELCRCGCLILPDETCPACLAWAIQDAIEWTWRVDQERYEKTYERRAA